MTILQGLTVLLMLWVGFHTIVGFIVCMRWFLRELEERDRRRAATYYRRRGL